MALHEGEQVGPYQIVGQLGQGGMATVYKAYHPELDRHVAIKVMHETFLEDQNFQERFRREARIVAALEHPHIVPIYGYDQYKRQPYLVMKFIEGRTLKEVLIKAPPTLEEVLHIITAVGSALTYAHEKGVLHRDIKPSNIVIDTDNIPYLADFGLARVLQAGESTMSQDMVLGTPHYISPEQAQGKKDIDGRTDIYSLGVVLYELVVGRVPFSADTPFAVIHDHIYTPLPLPTAVNPEIPVAVEAVLFKALAKRPADRHATANALVEDFRDAIEESNLHELSSDRATVAAVSIARLREQHQAEATPAYAPIRAAYITPAGVSSSSIHQPERYGRRWMIGGLVSFLIICMMSSVIALGAAENIQQIATAQALRTQSSSARVTLSPTTNTTNTISVEAVPELTLADSETYLDENAQDPIAYLARARALWVENDNTQATTVVREGLRYTDANTLDYVFTAAELAAATEHALPATLFYAIAYGLDSQDGVIEPYIRETAGQYLYRTVIISGNRVNFSDLVSNVLDDEQIRTIIQSPFLQVITARINIEQGDLSTVESTLEIAQGNSNDTINAEIALVWGELDVAQGNSDSALRRWQSVINDQSAPDWVRQRANTLIQSLGE